MNEIELKWVKEELVTAYPNLSPSDVLDMLVLADKIEKEIGLENVLDLLKSIGFGFPLSPVENKMDDWIRTDNDNIFQHKRLQSLFHFNDTYLNTNRMVCNNRLTGEIEEAASEFDFMLNAVYPISFPYFQTRFGVLSYVRHNELVILLSYVDECSGEVINFDDAFFRVINREPVHLTNIPKAERESMMADVEKLLGNSPKDPAI